VHSRNPCSARLLRHQRLPPSEKLYRQNNLSGRGNGYGGWHTCRRSGH
jgi:hypothetical protein